MRNTQFLVVPLSVMLAHEMQAAEEAATSKQKQAAELNWSMRYDSADRLISITDPAGRKTTIIYFADEKNRLRTVTREHADRSKVTWDLDQFGRRVSMNLKKISTMHRPSDSTSANQLALWSNSVRLSRRMATSGWSAPKFCSSMASA